MAKFYSGYYLIGFSLKIFLSAPSPKYQRNDATSPLALCIYLCHLVTQAQLRRVHLFLINILYDNLGTREMFLSSLIACFRTAGSLTTIGATL